MATRSTAYIGTSGWSYKDWGNGRFYPKGLRSTKWLEFYGERFGTVELNMSFYRLPKPDVVKRWHGMVDPEFRFAIKLSRIVTHRKRLKDCEEALDAFFGAVSAFGDKRGPLLVQLPPSLKRDEQLLAGFLDDLERVSGRTRWRVVVEFRDKGWLCDDVHKVLDAHGAALCLADLGPCPITEPNDVDFVYVRRHGPSERRYHGCYTERQVASDAAHVRAWLKEGRDVYVYYNNDFEGYAVDNAQGLIRMATGREAEAEAQT